MTDRPSNVRHFAALAATVRHGSLTRAARVWKAERFSWSLTRLTHSFPQDGDFERRMQIAEFDYLASSEAARTVLAENYVGLPL